MSRVNFCLLIKLSFLLTLIGGVCMDKINSSYETMLELNAELFISELIKQQKKVKLNEQIDEALARRDEQRFYELTSQLNEIE